MKRERKEEGREKQEVGRGWGGEKNWPLKVRVCEEKKTMNQEPYPGVGFHPIQKIPKRDFLDGALVGTGSLKPPRLTS
jgi:hypothetical protein